MTDADATSFAELSGDWNPLHTDSAYAAETDYGRRVLHGAFSAGLLSRLAGMHLPGRECLLHDMRLRFVAPIFPPATLTVSGELTRGTTSGGSVDATISDSESGKRYVEASYSFGLHRRKGAVEAGPARASRPETGKDLAPVLVSGATGALGQAVMAALGPRAVGLSRQRNEGLMTVYDLEALEAELPEGPIGGIVHCAWPDLDNEALIDLKHPHNAVEHNLATPLRQSIALARLIGKRGVPDATLVFVGSTAAESGRHAWRMPLYSLAKSMMPTLSHILAFELAATGHRCVNVVFDMLDGGLNKGLSPVARQANADRFPTGRLPTPEDAAAQVAWVLENTGSLISGSSIRLSGSALP